ncbi:MULTISPECIES: hypothetical protein [unclassified Bradyrhizobium]|jgi:hypothetical protein|uniref:hypothetical protein n=1 Tax=unclassified Bradyrhizobium TaxID=2631580 RepID=UPI001FF73CBF|nr:MULTISPECIES: hypothetical protein [unclassified Bradyrhizobium]MCK1519287.1 hypothetical protein [Bradyrhizobium sp. 17]UPJ70048.1 hypothetical protein IVB19_20205 [Bradyrhizobium sp. 187]
MRRTDTAAGAKFTVRGQVYIQTGHFYHTMGNDREVRVLELQTSCPECSQPFDVTASMRQISTRQLVRRCPRCRKIHTGPVSIAKPVARKTVKKNTTGRKMPAPAASRRAAVRKLESPSQITLLEIRPVDVRRGETPVAAMQRALSGTLDGPAEPPADLAQRHWCDISGMLD